MLIAVMSFPLVPIEVELSACVCMTRSISTFVKTLYGRNSLKVRI